MLLTERYLPAAMASVMIAGPGLAFGVATGAVMHRLRRFGPRRLALWVPASTLSYVIALGVAMGLGYAGNTWTPSSAFLLFLLAAGAASGSLFLAWVWTRLTGARWSWLPVAVGVVGCLPFWLMFDSTNLAVQTLAYPLWQAAVAGCLGWMLAGPDRLRAAPPSPSLPR